MERLLKLRFLFFLLIISSCDNQNNHQIPETATNLNRIYILGLDFFLLDEMNDYAVEGYLSDECSDELLREIHGLFTFLRKLEEDFVERTGGLDTETGYLFSADSLTRNYLNIQKIKTLLIKKLETFKVRFLHKETALPVLKFIEKIFNVIFFNTEDILEDDTKIEFFEKLVIARLAIKQVEVMYYIELKETCNTHQ